MEGLIDTRNEYIEHIQDILSVAISKRIYAIYTEMMELKKGLKGFQNELYSIRKWNNNMVNDEYKKIVKYTKCNYLSNLIKIIIITTIKIKIYEYREHFDNIKIKIPNAEDFVHKCYINAASFSWKNAYLYNKNNIKDAEYQNNLNIIEENIRSIIKKTFRDFIPFDEIFKQIEDNLTENVNQFKDTDEDEPTITNITKNNSEKKYKSTSEKVIAIKEKTDEDDEDDQEDEDDEEEDEDDQDEDDEEEDEADEADEADEDDEEDEADEADKEDEEDEEDEEAEEDEKDEDVNDNEDEEDQEDAEEDAGEDEEDIVDDDEDVKVNINEDEENTNKDEIDEIVKETNNKINNIVDTSLIKFKNDEYEKKEVSEEISFFKSEQANMQTKKDNYQEKERKNISNEWDNIKDEYNSLSQNKIDYKKFDTEIEKFKNKEIDDDTKSIASVASALSNVTDISQVKKIHINETASKKKPSFF
jgi:hypothetical protein